MKKLVLLALIMLCTFFWTTAPLLGDAGVLIPRDKQQPNSAILSLEEMEITVRIDNGDARVFVRQVFANHTGAIEEGNYIFALPSHATISDFATWDGPVRLPAVILERKRAEEIYNQLKQQSIDPGLLQMGERGAEEAKRSSVFSARITPIPSWGTKRLEIEYHESIPVENLKSYFAIPLRPDAYQAQAAARLRINFELHAAHAIRNFQAPAKSFPLQIDQNTPHLVRAHFEGQNVNLGEDFVATYDLDPAASDTLQLLTYRNPVSGQPSPTETAPVRSSNEPGFFEAEALLGFGNSSALSGSASTGTPKTVIVLFDTSLSMQWEKLERSYQALETLLHALRPADHFGLVLFNAETQVVPVGLADTGSIQHAIAAVRDSRLRGGTDLQRALQTGLQQASTQGAGNAYLVILSDGGATRGPIQNGKLAAWYASVWQQLPDTQRPRTYIFAVGDDANLPLFRMLARQDGLLEQVLSTEPMDFKLNSFLSKIGRSPVGQLGLCHHSGCCGRYGLSPAGRNFFRLPGLMGGTLSETPGKRFFHRARRARRHCGSNDWQNQPAARIVRSSAVAPTVGAGSRRRLTGKNRTRRRGSGHYRRNHPPRASVQICYSIYVVPGGSAGAAAAARDPPR